MDVGGILVPVRHGIVQLATDGTLLAESTEGKALPLTLPNERQMTTTSTGSSSELDDEWQSVEDNEQQHHEAGRQLDCGHDDGDDDEDEGDDDHDENRQRQLGRDDMANHRAEVTTGEVGASSEGLCRVRNSDQREPDEVHGIHDGDEVELDALCEVRGSIRNERGIADAAGTQSARATGTVTQATHTKDHTDPVVQCNDQINAPDEGLHEEQSNSIAPPVDKGETVISQREEAATMSEDAMIKSRGRLNWAGDDAGPPSGSRLTYADRISHSGQVGTKATLGPTTESTDDRNASGDSDRMPGMYQYSSLAAVSSGTLPSHQHPAGGDERGEHTQQLLPQSLQSSQIVEVPIQDTITFPGAISVPGTGASASSGAAATASSTHLDPYHEASSEERHYGDGFPPLPGNVMIEAVVVDEYQHVVDATVAYPSDEANDGLNGHRSGEGTENRVKKRRFDTRASNWCGCTKWTWAACGVLACFIVAMLILVFALAIIPTYSTQSIDEGVTSEYGGQYGGDVTTYTTYNSTDNASSGSLSPNGSFVPPP